MKNCLKTSLGSTIWKNIKMSLTPLSSSLPTISDTLLARFGVREATGLQLPEPTKQLPESAEQLSNQIAWHKQHFKRTTTTTAQL